VHADYAQGYRLLWEHHWWWRSREAYLLGWIGRLHRRAPRSRLRILDVGCGDGLFFERLEAFGPVEGLEPDANVVTDPRWRDQIRPAALGEPSAAVREKSYDLVLMLDVLEHIADDREALRAARSAVRPGGHLLLTVPALGWLWSRHDEVNDHFRRYNRSLLVALLRDAGFKVETVRYFFVWTVAPMLVRRWVSRPRAGRAGRPARDAAVSIPPTPVNKLLTLASRGEHALGNLIRWPIGSSLLALARA
jgi:SAM-dependent methyltransferase